MIKVTDDLVLTRRFRPCFSVSGLEARAPAASARSTKV